ncbi:glucosaminidase domain-containing protein, partial [Neobacillus niacini]
SGWFLDMSGVSMVEVFIDGKYSGQAQYGRARTDVFQAYPEYQITNSGYQFALNTLQFTEGQHTLTVKGTGINGATSTLNSTIFIYNGNYPKFVSSIKLPAYRSYNELADYNIHLTLYNPSYTRYFELGYGDLVNVLDETKYAARIATQDGRSGWVHKDYLETSLKEDLWLVKEARTLRSSSSVLSSNIGSIPSGTSLYLLDHVTTSDSTYNEWYYVQTVSGQRGWIWGALEKGSNQGYNVIKYEVSKVGTVTNQVNIFTPLNTKANVTADQINRFIQYKTSGKVTTMTGLGWAYLAAQEQSGLNAIYLLAHSGHETGWGNSSISKNKYNFYGIGAIDSKPAEGAYTYDTPEGGIIAGASWISRNYPIRDWDTDEKFPYFQPTIDNMRNDNSWHQYASDEAWAAKIGFFAQEFYNFINQ